jgi:hypothetical protein
MIMTPAELAICQFSSGPRGRRDEGTALLSLKKIKGKEADFRSDVYQLRYICLKQPCKAF